MNASRPAAGHLLQTEGRRYVGIVRSERDIVDGENITVHRLTTGSCSSALGRSGGIVPGCEFGSGDRHPVEGASQH